MLSPWKHSLLVGLALSPWSWADPKLGVDVHKTSDKVEIRLSQTAKFENVTQTWRENPHRLDITVPKVEWAGKAPSSIDRGVLQRIEVKSAPGSVTISVVALQNPKMSWVSSDDRKTWTLRVASTEIASNAEPPRLPGASSATAGAPAIKPVKPPVAVKPAKPPVAVTPAKPPVAVTPPPVRINPPVKSTPAAQGVEQKLISVNIQNKDLPTAIREMARAAGLEADIGPGVEGTVTAAFTDTPLARALTSVLGKQAKLYEFKIVNNRLQVFGDAGSAGTTLVPTPNTHTPPKVVNMISDYFPIVADKPVSEMVQAVKRAVADVEVIEDDRLNVLFVRGDAADIEKVRNLLRNVLAK